jgi:hypothetical protein
MQLNEIIESDMSLALYEYMEGSARTKQSRNGILGPSDIGFCRQKAVLVTRQVQPTDHPPNWSAAVGTSVHNYVEAALKRLHPDWLMGSVDDVYTLATLPSGAEIGGHPDIVAPDINAVLDIKTVNGFEWTRRNGPSQSHLFQRHIYALGLIQDGTLDSDREVLVGNIFLDRSGANPDPMVFVEPFDDSLTGAVDAWIGDVIYAVKNGEDSARDIPAAVCEKICEFFTVCRGGLEDNASEGVLVDPETVAAVNMYVDGRTKESTGKQMKKEAAERLAGISGVTDKYQVRWVQVQGNERLDVRSKRS